jgi:hypothetical protein
MKSRETGYFTDLRSGEVLEYWDNPLTGERCEVYHFYNDLIAGTLTTEVPKFMYGGAGDSPTVMNEGTVFPDKDGRYPFKLPFSQYGDDLMLEWDYAHEYTNPVTPEGWPTYSTGPKITPSEHFVMFASLRRSGGSRVCPRRACALASRACPNAGRGCAWASTNSAASRCSAACIRTRASPARRKCRRRCSPISKSMRPNT